MSFPQLLPNLDREVSRLPHYVYADALDEMLIRSHGLGTLDEVEARWLCDDKNALLWFIDDTSDAMPISSLLRLLKRFKVVGVEQYDLPTRKNKVSRESLIFLIEPIRGIFIVVDTLNNSRDVRVVTEHFNWRSHRRESPVAVARLNPSTGRVVMDDVGVWSVAALEGDAINYRLDRLEEGGKFIWPWTSQPPLQIWNAVNVSGWHGYTKDDIDALMRKKLRLIPNGVRAGMGFADPI